MNKFNIKQIEIKIMEKLFPDVREVKILALYSCTIIVLHYVNYSLENQIASYNVIIRMQ